ncbi:MAG TPA: tRNA uridine-5-carboxymethylaminomethyl(34) synthesis enzyme MnmG, partial [Verrucomicrobiae bacterium]|nr:tRNA uridine-5-carboxymethylaminomethyl(34) synthesis enzyme MnmG [Verrucomicrobiae bacterium]
FTSRAEHRLLLREDNADARLTPLGRRLGLVDPDRWRLFEIKQYLTELEIERLTETRVRAAQLPAAWAERVLGAALAQDTAAFDLLRRPGVSYRALLEVTGPPEWLPDESGEEPVLPIDARLPDQIGTQVEVRARYAGYLERQQEEVERARRNEETPLPADLDYRALAGLSHEVRQRLAEARPATVGQAGRVPGVTPAAVSILLVHLKKRAARSAPRVA